MSGLTSTGFETKTLEEILDEINQSQRTAISENLNQEADSVLGQINGIVARQIRTLWELAEEVYSSQYPLSASGFALSNVASITGTLRNAATKSTVTCSVTLGASTSFAIGELVAYVAGSPNDRFVNAEVAANPGGSPAAFDVLFESESTGPVRANAGTLTQIAEAVSGWTAITNALDADLGTDAEADSDLRARREEELSLRGSTTVDAIRADVAKVSEVDAVFVLENVTDTADGNGTAAHGIQVIVDGGDDEDIAAAIFASKAAGIATSGSETETVTDTMGIPHTIKFSRIDEVEIYVSVTVDVDDVNYVGDTALKEALVDFGDTLTIGADVYRFKLSAVIMSISGVNNITALTLGTTASPVGTADISIGVLQRAAFDTSRIVVTS